MMIDYIFDEEINLYTVKYNGETILECLSADELESLTVGEIKQLAENQK